MTPDLSNEELQELEAQLSCPSGAAGVSMGENMNATNINMTRTSITMLNLKDKSRVLELGHGNCGHLDGLLKQAKGILYTGLEVSETMYTEAHRNNRQAVSFGQAEFHLFNGTVIPFASERFDCVMTVNTIYFWKRPIELLNEIHRVLKPTGSFVVTFSEKEFMKKLPFVGKRFQLYDTAKVLRLGQQSAFAGAEVEVSRESEWVKSKAGDMVNRTFTVLKFLLT
ncbi:MAG: class I SAM-dependent methyltransferase [Bacteroidota bacterium]